MTAGCEKKVVVLARKDPAEAMRVASGLTVFGHQVSLVFAHGVLVVTPEVEKNAELIELAEVPVHSLFDDPEVPNMDRQDFQKLVHDSNFVINV